MFFKFYIIFIIENVWDSEKVYFYVCKIMIYDFNNYCKGEILYDWFRNIVKLYMYFQKKFIILMKKEIFKMQDDKV